MQVRLFGLWELHHVRAREIHRVAFPNEEARQARVEAVRLEQWDHAGGDVVPGNERHLRIDPVRRVARLLQVKRAGIVDLEISDSRSALANATRVQPRAEDHDLPAALRDLLSEPVVVIAGPEPRHVLAGREISSDGIGRRPRPRIEKNADDGIDIERMRLFILARAELGNDEGRTGYLSNVAHWACSSLLGPALLSGIP